MKKTKYIYNKDGESINRQKSLLYVFPAASDIGPNLKVEGQIEVLKSKYNAQLTTLNYPNFPLEIGFVKKCWRQIIAEFRFMNESFHFNIVYYRYNLFCPLYNLFIFFLSFIKPVWIEYNTVVGYHNEYPRWLKLLHWLQIRMLSYSKGQHLTVTQEIQRLEKLPAATTSIMPNAYYPPKKKTLDPADNQDLRIKKLLIQLEKERNNGKIILCMVFTSDFAWHGISIVEKLLEPIDNAYLLLIGDMKCKKERDRLEMKKNIMITGRVAPEHLNLFYD